MIPGLAKKKNLTFSHKILSQITQLPDMILSKPFLSPPILRFLIFDLLLGGNRNEEIISAYKQFTAITTIAAK